MKEDIANEPTPVDNHSGSGPAPVANADLLTMAVKPNSSWMRIVLLAVAYVATAAAGQLLSEPHTQSLILWPAAGLALAALLACGPRLWPGLWLGALLYHYLFPSTLDVTLMAPLFATGATLQALLGAHLTRPLLNAPIPLARERDAARFLLLAGPFSCIVSASVTTLAGYGLGEVTAGQAITMWILWSTGNTMGVLLFAPLLLSWPVAGAILPRSAIRITLPLLITTALLISGNLALNHIEKNQAHQQTTTLMEDAYNSGFNLLSYAISPLHGVERFFSASNEVTLEDYRAFSSYITSQPWILSVDWAPRVRREERAAFEASLSHQGMLESGIFDLDSMGKPVPSTKREEYFPVTLTEPMAVNAPVIGLDHAFEAPRRDAMAEARDTGRIAVTTMVPLLRTTQRAVLAYTPVYRSGFVVDQASTEERREALRGFVIGVFSIRQLFTALDRIASTNQLLYRVTDISSDGEHQRLWETLPAGAKPTWSRTVSFANRLWQLEMQTAKPAWQPGNSFTSRIFLGVSVLAAFLITFAVLSAAERNAVTTVQVLERTNDLARELHARRDAEKEIHRLNLALESKVEERTQALEALHIKERQLSAIVDNLPYGLITIDAEGTVHSANPAIEQVLGYRPTDLIGKNVSILMPEPDRSLHDSYIARYLRSGEAHIINSGREVQGQHYDGRLIPLELAVSEYLVHGKRFFIGSIWDISQRKHFITELTRARLDAEQASRAKSSFLAVMSHEIRTPMNGVIGLVDVLAHSRLSDYQSELVATIRESASTLLDIIDDILDFSKIDAGRMTVEHSPVCLTELIEGLCTSLQPAAAGKGVAISLFISPKIPPLVLSDSVRLRQALSNLIANAIKFSANQTRRKGYVSVSITLTDDNPQRLCFEIIDNGIGMTQTTLDQLFTAFTQAEASTTRRFGGTGLGLAITHRLIDLMQGEIIVDSKPGAGSRFTITLPFEPAAEQPARDELELTGIRCIVVESEDLSTAELTAYLEHAGAEVLVAADPLSAAQLMQGWSSSIVAIQDAAQQRPVVDPVLADIAGLRHLQFTRGRRQRPRLEALDVASLDYPFLKRRSLLHAVALAAGRASPTHIQEDALPQLTEETPRPDIAEARTQGRLILVAEDDALNQRVILQQLALLGYAAQIAGNGIEALHLWRQGSYAILLTDLQMPDMDGYVLAQSIRHEEAGNHHIPILALTANALREEAEQTRAAGMDEYLTKPLQLRQLREVLEKWMPKQESSPPHAPSSPLDHSIRPVDVTILQDMVGDDPDTVFGLLTDYRESLQHLTEELRAVYAQNDIRQVCAITHKLKSSSRLVGALALGELCADIERAGKAEDKSLIDEIMPQFSAAVAAVEADISKLIEKR